MAAKSMVRASDWARDLLKRIAEEEGASISEILDKALLRFNKDRILLKTAEGYERLGRQPAGQADLLREHQRLRADWLR